MPPDSQREFTWGPMGVTRLASVEHKKGRGKHYVLGVHTDFRRVELYVSPTGRNVRVFVDGKELK